VQATRKLPAPRESQVIHTAMKHSNISRPARPDRAFIYRSTPQDVNIHTRL
jgi:hypothetical protein